MQTVIGDYSTFLTELFTMIDEIELEVEGLELDHLCYRVQSESEYQQKKQELLEFGTLLAESFHAGRNISTFKLFEPIIFKERKIFLIELPAPKSSHSYTSGLEHVEFVTKENLQRVVNRHPQLKFEVFGIHKKINADVTLKLGNYCVRFHNQSLEDVIALEKKLKSR